MHYQSVTPSSKRLNHLLKPGQHIQDSAKILTWPRKGFSRAATVFKIPIKQSPLNIWVREGVKVSSCVHWKTTGLIRAHLRRLNSTESRFSINKSSQYLVAILERHLQPQDLIAEVKPKLPTVYYNTCYFGNFRFCLFACGC